MKYKFKTQEDKDVAIAAQNASHSETAKVHAKHLQELQDAEVTNEE
jgi:hypothetical protein